MLVEPVAPVAVRLVVIKQIITVILTDIPALAAVDMVELEITDHTVEAPTVSVASSHSLGLSRLSIP